MPDESVFHALSKFAGSAEENYLTEALAFLLRFLLRRKPHAATRVLNQLCGLAGPDALQPHETITIQTQVSTELGIPDLAVIVDSDKLVYIEVKHDAPLACGQLEAYHEELQRSGSRVNRLILLTRSRYTRLDTTLSRDQYRHICWYQIHNWLGAARSEDQVTSYFIRAFQAFLEEKQMSLPQVTWEYPRGTEALLNLVSMIEAAIREALPGIQIRRTAGWNWRGFYLGDNKEFFCGVRYDRLLTVVLENKGGIDPTYKEDLDLEQTHFFCLDKDEQVECLVGFPRRAYEGAP